MGSIRQNGGHDSVRHLLVGTFNTPELFVLAFDPSTNDFRVQETCTAIGNHSWLSIEGNTLLATCWTDPPSIASYRVDVRPRSAAEASSSALKLINAQTIKNRSGYVTAGNGCAYTAGGESGEVIAINPSGSGLSSVLQTINYVTGDVRLTEEGAKRHDKGRSVNGSDTNGINGNAARADQSHFKAIEEEGEAVMAFGGLRNGAHSADLSPDKSLLYVADIGRNCVWVHRVDVQTGLLDSKAEKVVSPRANDGPRHVWPHPEGKYVYVLQEHSCMVDVFAVHPEAKEGKKTLSWVQGVRIIPEEMDEKLFWADEVRLCRSATGQVDLLIASTRGLENGTKGYVALFALDQQGLIVGVDPNTNGNAAWLDLWKTPTSGGWANAVEPCGPPLHEPRQSLIEPARMVNEGQYISLTDSEKGLVMMLAVETGREGRKVVEVARLSLGFAHDGTTIRGAATAVWL